MRTVTFALNISLDGYCDHTMATPSEELMDYFTRMMDNIDLMLYGRIMYQLMFPYWADIAKDESGSPAENRYAKRLIEIDRVVMSTTLTEGDDKTTILKGSVVEQVQKLKQQPGKNISIDSVSLLPELINAGLIDEFHLVIHPILAGNGRRLLDAGSLQHQLNLNLVDTIRFDNGCVAQHYSR
ncbi:MAG: deaminase [Sphingobacteriales bacterium]|nr:MAG: deaminase [Sphingobacteriales bacterium]